MCTCQVCKTARQQGEYISPTYHHGKAEGFYRSEVCDCGFWTCGGRGCGDCPDCLGEHCECGLDAFLAEMYPEEFGPPAVTKETRLPYAPPTNLLRHQGIERALRSLRSDLIPHSKALSRAPIQAAIHAHNPTAAARDSGEFGPAETCWNCHQQLPIEVRTPPLGSCPTCGAVVCPF